jgi:anti-anti-sigma factor
LAHQSTERGRTICARIANDRPKTRSWLVFSRCDDRPRFIGDVGQNRICREYHAIRRGNPGRKIGLRFQGDGIMLIEVRCPNGHVLHVKEKYAVKIGACPRCSAPVRVPTPDQLLGEDRLSDPLGVHHATEESPHHARSCVDEAVLAADSSAFGFSFHQDKGKLCLGCGKIVSQSFSVCTRCGTPVPTFHHLLVKKEGDAIVVQFIRQRILDETTVKEITEELRSVADLEGPHGLVLNFSKVVALSSLMLGKLVMLQKRMEHEKRLLKLCNVGPEVRDVLAATKLDQVLHIEQG